MKKISSKSKAVISGILDFIEQTHEEGLLPEVATSLEREIKKEKGENQIVVTSVVPLTRQQLEKIKSIIEKNLKVRLPIVNKVSETLIGGFTIRVNDWFVDSSISLDLENLKRYLLS